MVLGAFTVLCHCHHHHHHQDFFHLLSWQGLVLTLAPETLTILLCLSFPPLHTGFAIRCPLHSGNPSAAVSCYFFGLILWLQPTSFCETPLLWAGLWAKPFMQHLIYFSQRSYKAVIINHPFQMRKQRQRCTILQVIVISEPGFDSGLSDLASFISLGMLYRIKYSQPWLLCECLL